jgi:hypothetical protein
MDHRTLSQGGLTLLLRAPSWLVYMCLHLVFILSFLSASPAPPSPLLVTTARVARERAHTHTHKRTHLARSYGFVGLSHIMYELSAACTSCQQLVSAWWCARQARESLKHVDWDAFYSKAKAEEEKETAESD